MGRSSENFKIAKLDWPKSAKPEILQRMKFRLFGLFILTLSIEINVFASNPPDDEILRIRLQTGLIQIPIHGDRIRFKTAKKEIEISGAQGTLSLIGLDGKKIWQWKQTRPTSRNILFPFEENLKIFGEKIFSERQPLPGQVMLVPREFGFDVLALVRMREYLIGVLSKEVPGTWPLETLKAQAIAARSYAWAVRESRRKEIFDLESSYMDQVYQPLSGENTLAQKMRAAVLQTENQVLVNSGGGVQKAFYHSDCGGHTVSSERVWQSADQTQAVTDPYCVMKKKKSWEYSVSDFDFQKKMKSFFSENHRVQQIRWTPEIFDQRLDNLELVFSSKVLKISGNQFRQALGFQNIKSTLFKIESKKGYWIFTGKGYGHGVGLCQHGAQMMGRLGKNYQEILKFYYPLKHLVVWPVNENLVANLNSSIVRATVNLPAAVTASE